MIGTVKTLEAPSFVEHLAEVHSLLQRDGAVRIRGIGPSEDSAHQLMRDLFGDSLRALPPAARVHQGGEQDRHLHDTTYQDELPVHTDGFAYGDLYPDYLLLVCVRSSVKGGESFLVDGYDVLKSLQDNPDERWVADALINTPVNQTEAGMQAAESPIVQRTDQGRLMVRRTLDQNGGGPIPMANSDSPARDQTMIDIWTRAIQRAESTAPRFTLTAGEAVIIDNYRMFHGREGYSDPARMMWRVWGWTTEALGVPQLPLHSDSRFARAEAEA